MKFVVSNEHRKNYDDVFEYLYHIDTALVDEAVSSETCYSDDERGYSMSHTDSKCITEQCFLIRLWGARYGDSDIKKLLVDDVSVIIRCALVVYGDEDIHYLLGADKDWRVQYLLRLGEK